MVIRQIETPLEIFKKIHSLDESTTETISTADIERLVENSELDQYENKILFYRLEINDLADAVTEELDLGDEDFSIYNELLHDGHKEIFALLVSSFKKIQRVIQRELVKKGNVVYCVAPDFGVPFDEDTLPFAWNVNRDNPNEAIKEMDDERDPVTEVYTNPEHPNMVTEKHVPYKRTDEKETGLVFAENLEEMEDLDNAVNLDLPQGVRVVIDAMKACNHLHSIGEVHRDIKLENIMVDRRDGEVKGLLCDHEFIVDEDAHCPEMKGSKNYLDLDWYPYAQMFGERARKEMDIFAFGMTLLLLPIEEEDREEFLEKLETQFSIRFSYALRDLLDKNPDIDVQSMFDDHPGYDEFLQNVSKFRLLNFDTIALVKDLLGDLQPSTHIPEEVLVLIGNMLSYYRADRPTLDEAMAILEKEYDL